MERRRSFPTILLALAILAPSCGPAYVQPSQAPTRVPVPTGTPSPSPSTTPTTTPTPTATFTPAPTPTTFSGADIALIGAADCTYPPLKCQGGGTFLADFQAGSLEEIWGGKYTLLDLSPDGKSALVYEGRSLYAIDLQGNDPQLITSYLPNTAEKSFAYWMPSGEVVYIGVEGAQKYIYLLTPGKSQPERLTEAGQKPYRLFPSKNTHWVVWEAGLEEPKGNVSLGMYRTTTEGDTEPLSAYWGSVSPSGNLVAYVQHGDVQLDSGTQISSTVLALLDPDTLERNLITVDGWGADVMVNNLKWLADERHLFVGGAMCRPTNQSGSYTCDEYFAEIINLDGKVVATLPEDLGNNQSRFFSLSRDSTQLIALEAVYVPKDGARAGYLSVFARFLELSNDDHSERDVGFIGESPGGEIGVSSLHWISPEVFEVLKEGRRRHSAPWSPPTQEEQGACQYPSGSLLLCHGSPDPTSACNVYELVEEDFPFSITGVSMVMTCTADHGMRSVQLRSVSSGEAIQGNLLVFDAQTDTYAASLVLGGDMVQFHGSASVVTDSDQKLSWIQLGGPLPLGVGDRLTYDQEVDRFAWQLPDGPKQFFIFLNYSSRTEASSDMPKVLQTPPQ